MLLCATLQPVRAAEPDPSTLCADAATVAERNWGLPQDIIHAIGRVESGRYDRATGRTSAWPWAVNAGGSGSFFPTKGQAVQFARTMQRQGITLIDVGCFQVDLFYHPTAFASLEEAFEPAANADYAARFLTALRAQTGDWASAIARYHSASAAEGESYRRKVMQQRPINQIMSAGETPVLDHAASRRLAMVPNARQDQFVVLMSEDARAIHVFRPSNQLK